MAYKHILAATDFSTTGNHAVRAALEEAALHGSKLTLLHVLHHQPDIRVYFHGGDPEARAGLRDSLFAFPYGFNPDRGAKVAMGSAHLPSTVIRDFDEETLEQLRQLVPGTFTGPWDAAVASGEPAHAIVQMAKEHAADLIVLGSHGHAGIIQTVLGDVSDKVVRRASCAVLIIRHP